MIGGIIPFLRVSFQNSPFTLSMFGLYRLLMSSCYSVTMQNEHIILLRAGITMHDIRFTNRLRTILLVLVIISIPIMICTAQDATQDVSKSQDSIDYRYDLGSQVYSVSIGPLFPLFIWTPAEPVPISIGTMHIGGYGSVSWDAFLDHKNSIGIELGYAFSHSLDNRMYSSIPILFRITHYFTQGTFDFPISIGLGAAYSSFDDQYYIGPVLKPNLGVYWNMDESWGFGVNVNYWFIPELYIGDYADQTSFGNFLGVNLSLKYSK